LHGEIVKGQSFHNRAQLAIRRNWLQLAAICRTCNTPVLTFFTLLTKPSCSFGSHGDDGIQLLRHSSTAKFFIFKALLAVISRYQALPAVTVTFGHPRLRAYPTRAEFFPIKTDWAGLGRISSDHDRNHCQLWPDFADFILHPFRWPLSPIFQRSRRPPVLPRKSAARPGAAAKAKSPSMTYHNIL